MCRVITSFEILCEMFFIAWICLENFTQRVLLSQETLLFCGRLIPQVLLLLSNIAGFVVINDPLVVRSISPTDDLILVSVLIIEVIFAVFIWGVRVAVFIDTEIMKFI